MSYKLLGQIEVSSQDLTIKDDYEKISLEYNGIVFNGKSMLSNKDNVALILEGDGMEIAVLYSIDSFSIEKKYRLIILEDDDWSLYTFIESIKNDYRGTNSRVKLLKDFYKRLENDFKKFEKDDYSTPSAPNTGIFRSSVSGKVRFQEKDYNHDSYSGITTDLLFSLRVGCGIESDKSLLLRAIAKAATDITTHYIKNAQTFTSCGSNFNTIAISIH